jgi:D-xylose transport system permease protein
MSMSQPGTGGRSAVGVVPAVVEPEAAEGSEDAALIAAPDVVATTLGEYVTAWWRRVRSGDSGVLPVIGAIVVIIIIFQVQDSKFLSAENIVNLLIQAVVIVLFGIGEIFVLLLGEIDLSVVFVAGIGAGLMAALVAPPFNLPWYLAVLTGIVATTVLGLIQGTLITRLRIPAFIVTLAGWIGWQGVMLWMFDHLSVAVGGVIEISNNIMIDITAGNLSPVASWVTMAALVVAFGAYSISRDQRRRAKGLVVPPFGLNVLKIATLAVAGIVLVLICNVNRAAKVAHVKAVEGVPWAVPIVLVVLAVATFVLLRTRFGRYVYAIGGNSEAARRAGINVPLIRTVAFGICGLMAGIAGLMYLSWLSSIATDIDPNQLLYAIAAAVIGGTSLLGGRGKPLHALLGGLVIAAIANGLGLLGMGAAATYMVTGLVLLAAITVDATARRGQGSAAR